MSCHIQLNKGHCVICQHSTAVGERVVAVLGNPTTGQPMGSTLPFKLPAHGHQFSNTTVYINRGKETWRLCRYPPCLTCSKSPQAFIFHVDCFWVAKNCDLSVNFSYIWLVGFWSCPGAGLHYSPRSILDFPALAAYCNHEKYADAPFITDIMKPLQRLSLELRQMVAYYCPESPLWRYSVAAAWPPKIFSKLQASKSITLLPEDMSNWTRGTVLPSCDRSILATRNFVRMTLDSDGIRQVEFLGSWPEFSSSLFPVKGTWYIMQEFSQFTKLQFQSRGGCLRLQHSQNCVMWDTPTPPKPTLCQFVNPNSQLRRRMRCIPLDKGVTGITVFSTGGWLYGIHAHRDRSAMYMYSELPLQLRETLVWLYFPLGPEEEIQTIWIYPLDNYKFKVDTSHGRSYTFGEHTDSSDESPLMHSPFDYLLCHDPEPGQRILSLGVGIPPKEPGVRKPKPLTNPTYPFNSQHIYYSQASLEGVLGVKCFLNDTRQAEPVRPCIGVILEYADHRRAALGECRLGFSETVYIIAPTILHLKPLASSENSHSGAWFTSTAVEAEELRDLGWEEKQMAGTLTWWFGVDVIEIVHSLGNSY